MKVMTLFSPNEQMHIALQLLPSVPVAGSVDSVSLWSLEVSEDIACALHRRVASPHHAWEAQIH